MGLYQYNSQQLELLHNVYVSLPATEEPDLAIMSFIRWLQQENQAKKYLKIQRWEYGIYKGQRIDECTDIPYLKLRLQNAPVNTPYSICIQETLTKLLDSLQ